MALTKCLECGHEVSTSATVCPNCGAPIKTPSLPANPPPPGSKAETASATTTRSRKKWWFLGCGCLALIAIIIGAVLIGLVTGVSIIGSLLPNAKIENLSMSGDTRVINNEFDWGENVSFDVRSVSSDPKDVTVEVRLLCSEGEWTRMQKVHLGPNETRRVSVFFQEPTIDATNLRSQVKVVKEPQ
jgi:zinc ribbon protein